MEMVVLSDDMTGALEVGAKMASEGIPCLVSTELGLSPPDLEGSSGVLIVDIETRHLSPSDAARRVRILAMIARERRIPHLYLKTDSTLRGNIGSQFEAAAGVLGTPLIYAPSYPELGRTVVDGRLFVEANLVGETPFGCDSLNPVTESHIPTLLARQCRLSIFTHARPAPHMSLAPGIHVFDGATGSSLDVLAVLVLERPAGCIAAGPAALAHHIARRANWRRKELEPLPLIENCLIVNGSQNIISARQIEHALGSGIELWESTDTSMQKSGWRIWRMEEGVSVSPRETALLRGRRIRDILSKAELDALFVFGGDTARAVVRALGMPSLHPVGEVIPGVPITRMRLRDRNARVRHIITKAGGFGPVDTLARVRLRLA